MENQPVTPQEKIVAFEKKITVLKKVVLTLLGLVILFCAVVIVAKDSSVRVPIGYSGVKLEFGSIEQTSYGPGLVWQIPYSEDWGNEVKLYSVQPERFPYELQVKTQEGYNINLSMSILSKINKDNVYIFCEEYTDLHTYQDKVVNDLLQQVMFTLSAQMSIWNFIGKETDMITDATNYIVNDALMQKEIVSVESVKYLACTFSPTLQATIDSTAVASQRRDLEEARALVALSASKRVKEEALQAYYFMANQVKADSAMMANMGKYITNPMIAQYELAKASRNWDVTQIVPNTLMMMGEAGEATRSGSSILPIIPMQIGTSVNQSSTNNK